MNASASLLNDTARSTYTYIAQLPYLKIALDELRELFELNNIPVTNETSAAITVAAGVTVISFSTTPALPSDLVDIRRLWERETGGDIWIPMYKRDFLPHQREGVEVSNFQVYTYNKDQIEVLESGRSNDLKLDYIREIFTTITDENSLITPVNCKSFLSFRNAALCSLYIGENPSRAETLDNDAGEAIERALGISIKGRQSIAVRHKPFRAGYKKKGF